MRRRSLVVALCCLVLLAGCGGGPGGTVTRSPTATPTPTDGGGGGGGGGDGGGGDGSGSGGDGSGSGGTPSTTTSPTPTPGGGGPTPTATPTPGGEDRGASTPTATPSGPYAGVSFPPGTNESGVRNRSVLFAAHRATLADSDYAVNLTQVVVAEGERTRTVSLIRSDLGAGRLLGDFSSTTDDISVETFRNDSRFYRRQVVGDRTSYRVRNTTGTFESYHTRRTSLVASSASIYQFADFAANGTVQRGNRTLIRFDLVAVNESAVSENATVTSAEGTLLIDERGLIHSSRLELRGESDAGDRRRLLVEFRVTETGDVTVQRPDWLSTAAAESG